MEKLKQYKYIILITLVILGLIFYWFQFRPVQIKKDCWNQIEQIKNGEIRSEKYNMQESLVRQGIQEAIDTFYSNCLKEHGLDN